MGGARHEARRLALQALYALQMNPDAEPGQALEHVAGEGAGPAVDLEFARNLVSETWGSRAELDRIIGAVSHRWKVRRMDRVDLAILRLSTHELLHRPETPTPVILDEGIELAKEFGTPEAPSFVNGILDRVAREQRSVAVGNEEE